MALANLLMLYLAIVLQKQAVQSGLIASSYELKAYEKLVLMKLAWEVKISWYILLLFAR